MSDHEGLVQDQLLYIEHLEAERDALAAHLEHLFETFNRIAIEGEGGMYSPRELEDALCAIFSDGPDASLTRCKAQWQAEALEAFAERNTLNIDAFHDLMQTVKRLRHAAEEGES